MSNIIKLIVGLGNKGREYVGTRHNIGFEAVDSIAEKWNITPAMKFNSELFNHVVMVAQRNTNPPQQHKIYMLKPHTYMNNSGVAVANTCKFFKILPENVLVIHDDIDLNLQDIRIKIGGGHGGHNGLKSIDSHLGQRYWRCRLGIGRPIMRTMVSDYVLSRYAKDELANAQDMVALVVGMVEDMVGNIEQYSSYKPSYINS